MPEPMSDERLAEIERRLSDPHTYGAVGDGVKDDYPAVQAALNVSKDVSALIAEVRRLRAERADVVAARLLEATEMKAIILQRALNLIGADDAIPS